MKLLSIICLLLCLSLSTQASGSLDYQSKSYAHYNANLKMMNMHYANYHNQQLYEGLEVQLSRAEKYNKAGNILLGVGVAATIVGVIMMATADEIFYTYNTSSNGQTETEGDIKGALGLSLTMTGVAGIITGAIFKGKAKKSR